MLRTLTTLAVACYAANGALKAIRHELEVIGALAIAIITAVGGGTARDLLLDRPVFIGARAANASGAPFVSTVLTGGLTGFGGSRAW